MGESIPFGTVSSLASSQAHYRTKMDIIIHLERRFCPAGQCQSNHAAFAQFFFFAVYQLRREMSGAP